MILANQMSQIIHHQMWLVRLALSPPNAPQSHHGHLHWNSRYHHKAHLQTTIFRVPKLISHNMQPHYQRVCPHVRLQGINIAEHDIMSLNPQKNLLKQHTIKTCRSTLYGALFPLIFNFLLVRFPTCCSLLRWSWWVTSWTLGDIIILYFLSAIPLWWTLRLIGLNPLMWFSVGTSHISSPWANKEEIGWTCSWLLGRIQCIWFTKLHQSYIIDIQKIK
jgi:hypothetical protein